MGPADQPTSRSAGRSPSLISIPALERARDRVQLLAAALSQHFLGVAISRCLLLGGESENGHYSSKTGRQLERQSSRETVTRVSSRANHVPLSSDRSAGRSIPSRARTWLGGGSIGRWRAMLLLAGHHETGRPHRAVRRATSERASERVTMRRHTNQSQCSVGSLLIRMIAIPSPADNGPANQLHA